MNRVLFYDGQDVLTDDLDALQNRIIADVKARDSRIFSPGIINDEVDILETNADDTLSVAEFHAIDINGEYIHSGAQLNIAPDTTQSFPRPLIYTSTSGTASWESDVTYVITVVYTEADAYANPISYHPVTGEMMHTRVNTPDAAASEAYILYAYRKGTDTVPTNCIILGEVVYSSTTLSLQITYSACQFLKLYGRHVYYTIPTTVEGRVATYSLGDTKTVEDHMHCLGTGVVSSKNPHAIAPIDIGIDITNITDHEKRLHVDGILGDPETTLSCDVNYQSGAPDTLLLKGLYTNDQIVVYGSHITNTELPVATDYEIIPESLISMTDGDYVIYYDSLTDTFEMYNSGDGSEGLAYTITYNGITTQKTIKATPVTPVITDFLLWGFTWAHTKTTSTAPDHTAVANVTALVDLRYFGNIASQNLNADSATDTFTIDHNVTITKDLNISGNVYGAIPIGIPVPFVGTSAQIPTNFLELNGSQVLIDDYPTLYSLCLDRYNNGSTPTAGHFYIPDMRYRIPVGAGTATFGTLTVGTYGGEKDHQLTVDELASHSHVTEVTNNTGSAIRSFVVSDYPGSGVTLASETGGDVAHNNMQPYIAMTWMVRAK